MAKKITIFKAGALMYYISRGFPTGFAAGIVNDRFGGEKLEVGDVDRGVIKVYNMMEKEYSFKCRIQLEYDLKLVDTALSIIFGRSNLVAFQLDMRPSEDELSLLSVRRSIRLLIHHDTYYPCSTQSAKKFRKRSTYHTSKMEMSNTQHLIQHSLV